jgi:hypothetical protein
MPENLDSTTAPRRMQVADFLAILIGLSLIGVALYGASLIDRGLGKEIRHGDAVWTIQLLSGSATIAGIGLAQWMRWRTVGRALVALAGLLLLGGLVFFYGLGWRAWLTFALPGILLVVLSRVIGPIPPPPAQSGQRRSP